MRRDDLKFNINLSHKASPLAIREEFGLPLELLCLFNLLLEVPVAIIAHTPKLIIIPTVESVFSRPPAFTGSGLPNSGSI